MIYIIVILILLTIIFITRYLFLKKEIKHITKQLTDYHRGKTVKQVDIVFYDKDVETMAKEINHIIDYSVNANIEKSKIVNTLKQVIANMSHDLKTPMTSISGYIQLLESDKLTEAERKEYLGVVKNRTKRLQDLLMEFFELSLVESLDYELHPASIKINKVIREVFLNYYDTFNQLGLSPYFDLPETEVIIYADEAAVKRVLENLISNTIKHAAGSVEVSLIQSDKSVKLTISNDIKNMEEFDVEKIFDRFYTGDKSRSKKGTGLGLSIAKGLMEKMDGDLKARYEKGRLYMTCIWIEK